MLIKSIAPCSSIHKGFKLETTNPSRRMDTQAVVHPRDGMYPASNPLLLRMTEHQKLDMGESSPYAFFYRKFRTSRISLWWGGWGADGGQV